MLTVKEHFIYNRENFPSGFLDALEREGTLGETEKLKKEIEVAEGTNELLREQLYFAQSLVNEIRNSYERHTKCSALQQEIRSMLAETMFES